MKELQYKYFSLKTRKKNRRIRGLNVCQFELTFRCGLDCNYCYTKCYNKPEYIKNELDAEQVKFILDKVYNAGVIWLCFTGGDPLERDDFLDTYSYAKDKGFIITIFTNGYSMTKEIADYLEKRPPFVIEITLNAVTEKTYEEISQVKDSFGKVMDGLKMITERNLSLKIKTQAMKDNLEELPKIKEFVENLGLKFRPSPNLYPSLNGDLTPCNLRISPEGVLSLDKRPNIDSMEGEEKGLPVELVSSLSPFKQDNEQNGPNEHNAFLFRCGIWEGAGINLDPYGNMFLCNLIRQPSFNLLEESIEDAFSKLLPLVRGRKFTTDSKCKDCKIREFCRSCPGMTYLETGDIEAPIDYYCKLAYLFSLNYNK